MKLNYQRCWLFYQQHWCFALSGGGPEITTKPGAFRRTLRRVSGQFTVLAFVVFDIGALGFALVAPVWVAPWVAINVTALVLGSLSWSEDRRIQRENATATRRQGEKVRAAEWRTLEELHRETQRQRQEAERRQRQKDEECAAQKRLQATVRQAQEQLRESEQRRYQEEKEREVQRQQKEQVERLRQAKQKRREAEGRRQQAQEKGEARRERQRRRTAAATQFHTAWWIVLGVAPTASKDDIVRKYRHKIKQCHPDRVIGIAPKLLHLAEEQTKALNAAYANAMRAQQYAERNGAAA